MRQMDDGSVCSKAALPEVPGSYGQNGGDLCSEHGRVMLCSSYPIRRDGFDLRKGW